MAEQINTASEVIDALGGPNAVAKLLQGNPRAVSNWKRRGLPPKTFLALSEALKAKGYEASPSLWKQREIDRV